MTEDTIPEDFVDDRTFDDQKEDAEQVIDEIDKEFDVHGVSRFRANSVVARYHLESDLRPAGTITVEADADNEKVEMDVHIRRTAAAVSVKASSPTTNLSEIEIVYIGDWKDVRRTLNEVLEWEDAEVTWDDVLSERLVE